MRKKRKDLKFANGYGGIIYLGERRRKPYAVRITIGWGDDKKQKYKYLGYFEKRTDALECLVQYNASPYDVDMRKYTLMGVWEAWYPNHFKNLSPSSIANYKSCFRKLDRFYGTPMRNLRAKDFQPIFDSNGQGNRNVLKSLLKCLYRYSMENDIVEKDYSQFIVMKKAEKKPKNVFAIHEIEALWERQGEEYADLLLILLYTGMRVSELLEMRAENVDMESRYMIGGMKTDNGKNRIIPIHPKIAPIVERRKGAKWMFPSTKGNMQYYKNIGSDIHAFIRKDLGFDHTIHETRHTFISQATKLGMNPIHLRKIVGHRGKDITESVYTHVDAVDLVLSMEVFRY